MAFLKGMHRFEFLLRDFIGAKAACHPRSMILILREYRPDLRLHVLDCPPGGLVAITRLKRASSVLADRYHEIVDQHAGSVFDEDRLRSFWDKLELTASRPLCEEPDHLTELFTLTHHVPGWHQ